VQVEEGGKMTTTTVSIYLSQTADGFLCAVDEADVLLAKARSLSLLRQRLGQLIRARYGIDAKLALMVGRPPPAFMQALPPHSDAVAPAKPA
jgi:hypothetical protein